MIPPPTEISLREGGPTLNFDLNLCLDKGVSSHSLGYWFPSSRTVTISRAVTTTRSVTGQAAQGGPGSPIPSTETGQKALGELQKKLSPLWVTLGAGHPGGFHTDEITCIQVKSEGEGIKWGRDKCQESTGSRFFFRDNNLQWFSTVHQEIFAMSGDICGR